jgi:hypothetical protein
VGRPAITAAAQGFMTAFPDLLVVMDSLPIDGNHAVYHWTLTGTNTGPGGYRPGGTHFRLRGVDHRRRWPDRVVRSGISMPPSISDSCAGG